LAFTWFSIYYFFKFFKQFFLGVWHYSFANLSTSQRFLAGIFYSRPPNSTYVEALRHFENAEAIKVFTFFKILFRHFLAWFLLCQ